MSRNSESEDATPLKRNKYDLHFKLEVVAYAEKYNMDFVSANKQIN